MADNYSFHQFTRGMDDTHAYIDNAVNRKHTDTSYLRKGTGHMVRDESWEPQRINNFEVVIEGLDTLRLAGTNDDINLGSMAERIMLSVDSFSAPTIEIAQITTHYANNSIKWAGKPDFPNSSLVINDYIGQRVETLLAAWFQAAYNFQNETIGLAKHYKKTAYLIEYAPDGSESRVWRLEGCWLASFQLGDWNQQGNEQRKLNATLVYDRVIPDYGLEPSTSQDWANKIAEYGQNTSILNTSANIKNNR